MHMLVVKVRNNARLSSPRLLSGNSRKTNKLRVVTSIHFTGDVRMVIHAVHLNSSKQFTPALNSRIYFFIYTGSPTL